MKKYVLSAITLLLVLNSNVLKAAEVMPYNEVIEKLNTLLKAKDYIAAYEFGDAHTYEHGGEPEFDLLVGLAAYGNEMYQESVFAFERVLLIKPGSFLARYYLALSYRKVDNLHAAITELEKLLTRPLTQTQRDKAEALLNRVNRILINRNLSWYQQISSTVAFDNNVNSGTDERSITIPNLGEVQLFDESRATKDLSYSVGYNAGYQYPISQFQWFKLDVSASYNGYVQKTEYQRFQYGVTLAYEQELLRGKLSFNGFTRPLWREIETAADLSNTADRELGPYRVEQGVSMYFQKDTSRKTGYRLGGSYSQIVNDVSPELDLVRAKVSGAFQYKTRLLQTIIGHYQQDEVDDSNSNFNAKDSYGVTYQVTWPISNTVVSNSYVMLENHKYVDEHPLFGMIRDESMTAISSQLLFNTSDKLQLKLSATFQDKVSNVDLFSYDRFEVAGSWQYRF